MPPFTSDPGLGDALPSKPGLPRPATGELDLEREAQEGSHQDDHGQDTDARERRPDDDGPDDVTGHEQLEPEEDALTD